MFFIFQFFFRKCFFLNYILGQLKIMGSFKSSDSEAQKKKKKRKRHGFDKFQHNINKSVFKPVGRKLSRLADSGIKAADNLGDAFDPKYLLAAGGMGIVGLYLLRK